MAVRVYDSRPPKEGLSAMTGERKLREVNGAAGPAIPHCPCVLHGATQNTAAATHAKAAMLPQAEKAGCVEAQHVIRRKIFPPPTILNNWGRRLSDPQRFCVRLVRTLTGPKPGRQQVQRRPDVKARLVLLAPRFLQPCPETGIARLSHVVSPLPYGTRQPDRVP